MVIKLGLNVLRNEKFVACRVNQGIPGSQVFSFAGNLLQWLHQVAEQRRWRQEGIKRSAACLGT